AGADVRVGRAERRSRVEGAQEVTSMVVQAEPAGVYRSCLRSSKTVDHASSVRARSASRSVSRVSTYGGTSRETSPPNMATSLTSEEARKEYSGLHGMN